jgi:anti-sigma regulatory factor (Ser/Thr protein kinase)
MPSQRKEARVDRRLHLTLWSDASLAKKLRNEVRVWLEGAGINGPVGIEITSAVNEAFLNAVEHPLDRLTDQVDVDGDVSSNGVVVRVRDDGAWNDKLDTERQRFGLGVITALTDSLQIEHGAAGSVVTLRRKL